jgi:tRNA A-37 threonylcarbamoyl transferase component Bud32
LAVAELALVDMEFRWRAATSTGAGDAARSRPSWQQYASEHPTLVHLEELDDAAIVEEYRVRHRWGDRPSHIEFSRSYPQRDLTTALERIDAELRSDATSLDLAASSAPDERRLCVETPYDDLVLTAFIGQGGMGKVYRALHKPSGKFVAVKALRKDRQTEPMAVEAFLREADVVARLDHPNIVRLWGMGRFPAGGRFIVLDLVDGTDLQQRINHSLLEARETARIGIAIANALAHAHAAGVVHCDIKPANVLIDVHGTAYLTDFGFARLLAANVDDNARHIAGGTRSFAAPEQFTCPTSFDRAVDVYGVGAMLFALLTGSPPNSATREISDAMAELKKASSPLSVIVARCLNVVPSRRFSSAAELADALRSVRDTI